VVEITFTGEHGYKKDLPYCNGDDVDRVGD